MIVIFYHKIGDDNKQRGAYDFKLAPVEALPTIRA